MSSRCSGRDERRGVRIDVDALAAGDLDQALPRQIGVIIDLRVRRGDQNAGLMAFGTSKPGTLAATSSNIRSISLR